MLLTIIALLIAVTVHEFSHALAAERLGDPTPRLMGRLTLNPIPHLDPIGSILVPLLLFISGTRFLFAWAKPVQFDPFNLRNPRRDAAIISIAGPVANLVLAILGSILLNILFHYKLFFVQNVYAGQLSNLITDLLTVIIYINVILAIFNLIPIHPLDGFKVVEGILPHEYARQWAELEPYGLIFLIFLIFPFFGGESPITRLISPIINTILSVLLPSASLI